MDELEFAESTRNEQGEFRLHLHVVDQPSRELARENAVIRVEGFSESVSQMQDELDDDVACACARVCECACVRAGVSVGEN